MTDRITVVRSITLARLGRCSHTSSPASDDGIGCIEPRISTGAPGFISNVSSWLGEPYRNSTMQSCSAETVAGTRGGLCLRLQQRGQTEASDGRTANLEEIAARQSVAKRFSVN